MTDTGHLMRWLWSVVAAGAVATACTDYKCNDFSEYHRIPRSGWHFGDTLKFNPVHHDSLCAGRIAVAVTHTVDYPYTHLWLEVLHSTEDGVRRDTLSLPIVDRYGTWLGHGIGATFQVCDTLPVSVHPSGSLVGIRQIMRCDTLAGVNSVGIFFVPD